MPSIDQETTLMASATAGGGLISNAKWRGTVARPHRPGRAADGVVEALLHGADGYSDSVAIKRRTTTLVVYEMNGEPLPERHGYPVRLIVPGLFGEKNIKWVTRVELVDHDAKGFYEEQGWGQFRRTSAVALLRPRSEQAFSNRTADHIHRHSLCRKQGYIKGGG
ncbi:MAG: molybdopterin-dependent oxidoreductase [Chloroflexia bacterium]